ncbi:Fur family transcriptional regulator, ferric uptake regulator [Paenibacillus sp. UNCCL117]|uniref:ferric iron uptake transcriptional regulator n=1 Tax=unclassified Paenibacillus TaxID=185978 RepID=UPI0008894137|nr:MULTISPECIES: Fur family transcriptional regulator [unclassified Paenibacillus]SDC43521.1 Fur family transcriptional regulator, ferric uptake regulator [Paenibacillus sp. cl123]SFW12938.1 Fur family transcriptional regulator, ferric uptake regulator [Paenibacillus sp. UNCCL117]
MVSIVDEIDKLKQQLMLKGHKLTPQREVTLRVLLENEADHLSAEDVFMLVKERFPDIGLATVYRTLELLAELHIVEKMNFGDGVARFDLRSDDHDHMHHHLICHTCGALNEIKDDWLLELEERLLREYGFQVTDHRLDFIGNYHACKSGDCRKECGVVS